MSKILKETWQGKVSKVLHQVCFVRTDRVMTGPRVYPFPKIFLCLTDAYIDESIAPFFSKVVCIS